MNNLYMFAIMPPDAEAKKIHKERQILAQNYNCEKALKPPVHITLYDPFITRPDFEKEIAALQNWSSKQAGFSVELKNFNFFKNPEHPVVYIDVVKNESLTQLHKKFLLEFRKYLAIDNNSKTYTPHVTIGYRDVPPSLLPDIVQNYSRRPFQASFEVNGIYLWRHNGRNWQVQNEFKFGGAEANEYRQKSLFD